jgi:hypothetical protein
VITSPVTLDDLDAKASLLLGRAAAADRRFFKIEAAAVYCGLSPESILRLVSGGNLTALRAVKSPIVLDCAAIDAYLLSRITPPNREGR